MMLPLAFGWYSIQLLLYPLRYALFLLHSLAIFFTKPGARFVVPAGLGVLVWQQWHWFGPKLLPWADWLLALYETELNAEVPSELFQWRLEVSAFVLFGALTILIINLSRLLRPIIGAFPAPRMPLRPHPPFWVPNPKVRRVPVRVSVVSMGQSLIGGDLRLLRERMPPGVQDLLARQPMPAGSYPGPTEVTKTRPLWPPLELQTAAATAAPAPASRAASKPRTAAPKAKKPAAAAGNPPAKEPYIPPAPPKRGRKSANAAE